MQGLGDRLRIAIFDPGGRSPTLDALRLRSWDWRANRAGFPNSMGEPRVCSVPGHSDRIPASDVLSADFYRSHLLDDLLPFWARAESGGAFQISHRRNGTSWDGPAPSATAQARMVYAFARGYDISGGSGPGSGFGEIAARAVEHLIRTYWDREYGGWYKQADARGTVVDDSKFSFDQAYVLSGLAEYVRVTDDELARRYLIDTLKLIEDHLWDPLYKGYFHWFERDWSLRHSRKILCIHVDLLAGLLSAHATLPGHGLLNRVEALAGVMRDLMLDPRSDLALEEFRRDFVYSPFSCEDTLQVGHTFKVAKHFLTVSDLTDDPSYAEAARQMADRALRCAWDHEYGGLFHEVYRNGAIKSGEKVWWTVCEGLITLLMLFERTKEQDYLDRYRELVVFAFEHFADPEFGEWITSTHRDGAPKCTNKGGTLEKSAFHTVEMASYAAANLK